MDMIQAVFVTPFANMWDNPEFVLEVIIGGDEDVLRPQIGVGNGRSDIDVRFVRVLHADAAVHALKHVAAPLFETVVNQIEEGRLRVEAGVF